MAEKEPMRKYELVVVKDGVEHVIPPSNQEIQMLREEEAMLESGLMGPVRLCISMSVTWRIWSNKAFVGLAV